MVFDGCGSWFYCFKILHALLSSPMLATNPAHLISLIFHHPYSIWWEVHIQKFLIMQFPLTCCCLEVHISSSAPTTRTPSTHICNFTFTTYIFMQNMKLSHILTTILFTITKWFDIPRKVISTQNFKIMNYMTIAALSITLEMAYLPQRYYCY